MVEFFSMRSQEPTGRGPFPGPPEVDTLPSVLQYLEKKTEAHSEEHLLDVLWEGPLQTSLLLHPHILLFHVFSKRHLSLLLL